MSSNFAAASLSLSMATPAGPSTLTNPFRTPHLTPQNTNQSSSSAPAVAVPQPQQPQRTGTSLSDTIPDEAPPAYTPAADPYQGEATVEFGPRRPFQQAPPPSVVVSPQTTGTSATNWPVSAQQTGTSLPASTPPQSIVGVFSPPPGRPPPPHRPPPPRHPSTASAPPPTSPQRAHTPPQHFAPPAGPPPRRAVSSASMSRASANAGTGVPDDGRPTTTPMPGHPLLRDGRMLVYPVGYVCSKCNNTGYKNFDPSHPCRKCWERHAKPYAGALVYAPTASSSNGPNGNFQRPLPTFRPPHAHAHGHYPGAMHRALTQTHPMSPPPPQPATVFAHPFAPPPPGATVVNPGDPRIGGRLCWRCGGRGSVSFMIFDQETCEVCNGMGRVFN